MPSNESNPPIQSVDEDVKKGRAFEPLPKQICYFKSAVIKRRLTTIYLYHPVTSGAQACVFKRDGKKQHSFVDGIIVVPSSIITKAMDYDAATGAALAVSATIHKSMIRKLNTEIQSTFVKGHFKDISARIKSEKKKFILMKQMNDDLEQLQDRVKGKALRVIERIYSSLTDLMVTEASSKWSPIFLAKNGIKDRKDLQEYWWVINRWEQLKEKSWPEIWMIQHSSYKQGFKKLDSDATTLASAARKDSIEGPSIHGGESLRKRFSKLELFPKSKKSRDR